MVEGQDSTPPPIVLPLDRKGMLLRPAIEKDRQALTSLIHFEAHVHRHLDWRPPLDWIGRHPYLVAEKDGRLLAVLACPPDLPDVSWVRLFAASSRIDVTKAWNTLWPAACEWLGEEKIVSINAIQLQDWFGELLINSGFIRNYEVILLAWDDKTRLPLPQNVPIRIRPMDYDDLPQVQLVDQSAFGLEWQNSLDALHYAYRQSTIATVAEDSSGLLGYQISTSGPLGGHLARLAVHIQAQNRGVGYALVYELLTQFRRKGIGHITVNTQGNNLASLSLYKKAGFQSTGESYPVFQMIPCG